MADISQIILPDGTVYDIKDPTARGASNTKVTQNNTNADEAYKILLSKSADNATETDEVNKNTNFFYNPSKQALTVGSRMILTTIGTNSTSIGSENEASGSYSFAEGYQTQASNSCSHSEGQHTISSGTASHSEGMSNTASGNFGSHAEGYDTTSSGMASHSEGSESTASGDYSHSEGLGTKSQRKSQHVFGEYNTLDTQGSSGSNRGKYVEIVGNGTGSNARNNARTLDWDGNEVLKGHLTTTDIKKPSGSTWDGTNASLSTAFKAVFDALLNADTNIVKWTKVTTFSQFDVYLYKFGIVKFLWIDTAKNNISSGWQSGGVGNLPSGYGSIFNPQMNENKTLRNGVQMTITVNSSGNLNINPTASIASGTQIRIVFIYI